MKVNITIRNYSIALLLFLHSMLSFAYAANEQTNSLKTFLNKNNLSQYYESIFNEGYEELQDLLDADDDELRAIGNLGLKPPHKRKLIRVITKAKHDAEIQQLKSMINNQKKKVVYTKKSVTRINYIGVAGYLRRFTCQNGEKKNVNVLIIFSIHNLVNTVKKFVSPLMHDIVELGRIMGTIDYCNEAVGSVNQTIEQKKSIYENVSVALIDSARAWGRQLQQYKKEYSQQHYETFQELIIPNPKEIGSLLLKNIGIDMYIFNLVRCLAYLFYKVDNKRNFELQNNNTSSTINLKSMIDSVSKRFDLEKIVQNWGLDTQSFNKFVHEISKPVIRINIQHAKEYQTALHNDIVQLDYKSMKHVNNSILLAKRN